MNRPAFSARSVLPQAENTFNAATSRYQVVFNSAPEQETTWRAATFRIRTCGDVEAEVKPGTEPAPPFGAATPHVLSKAGPTQYRDMRVRFEFTAGAVGTAPQSHGPVNTTVTEPAGPGVVGPGPRRHLVAVLDIDKRAVLSEYGVPVEGRTRLWADVTHPGRRAQCR